VDDAVEEVVRAELIRSRDAARRRAVRGGVLVASVPLVVGGALVAVLVGFKIGFPAMLLAGGWTLFAGLGGTNELVHGISDHRTCARQLRGLDERRQLPEARLLR
jgi:hypothetical protein